MRKLFGLCLLALIFVLSGCPLQLDDSASDEPSEKSEKSEKKDVKKEEEKKVVKKRRAADDYYFKKLEEFTVDNPKREKKGIVFLGDSLTDRFPLEKYFEGVNVINRGIGGDKINGGELYDVFDRLDESVYSLEPSKVFIMIGINDVVYLQPTTEDLIKKYKELIKKIHKNQPKCEIYIQSMLPLRGKFNGFNTKVVEVNAELMRLAEDAGIKYIDLHARLKDDDGSLKQEYTRDDIHLTEAGYDVWAKAVKKFVVKKESKKK